MTLVFIKYLTVERFQIDTLTDSVIASANISIFVNQRPSLTFENSRNTE